MAILKNWLTFFRKLWYNARSGTIRDGRSAEEDRLQMHKEMEEIMYQVGEKIVYGGNGVCVVDEIRMIELPHSDSDAKAYYVLRPIFQDCKISVPVDTKIFMRPMITAEQAQELVDSIPEIDAEPYYNTALRQLQDHYEQKISSHSCSDLVELSVSLHRKKKISLEQKKKFGAIDERYLKRAEDLLFGELAAALEIPRDHVRQYIENRLGLCPEG